MTRRGMAALGTIVVIASLMLTLVLIMAGISIVPLRMANQHLLAVQARMTALAALEQFRFDYLTAAEMQQQGTSGLDFSNPPHPALDLANRYNANPVFTNPGQMDNAKTTITFDPSKPFFSKDNLVSELPAAGCEDVGTANTSVPAFSADLVINVTNNGNPFHFDAVLSQVWDYAVFSLSGMTLDQNTTVTGNVGITAIDPWLLDHGSASNQFINIGSGGTDPTIPTNTLVDGDGRVLFSRADAEAAIKAHIQLPNLVHVLPGGQLTGSEVHDLIPSSSALANQSGGLNIIFPSPSGFATGTFTVVPEDAMRAWQDLSADGSAPPSISIPNPLAPQLRFASNVKDPTSMVPVPAVPTEVDKSASNMNYLAQSLTLDGTTGPSKVYVNTSITNYRPTFTVVDETIGKGIHKKVISKTTPNDPSLWTYSGAGLSIKDCVLFVDGDLDLVHGPPPKAGDPPVPDFSVYGDNATLIVSGSLRVEQGQLQASDRGLVVLADAISLESGGSYRGLLVARQELRIVPMSADNTLKVEGSIFAKGSNLEQIKDDQNQQDQGNGNLGTPVMKTVVQLVDNPIQISSTSVDYNARYVKGLNSLGVLTLKTWRLLP